jgi:hypothetical protein
MSRTGPVTKDTSTIALGLAKILVGPSATNIDTNTQVLDETTTSMGALNSTNFTSNVEYWRLLSGFPMMEDLVIPLSETAALECEFKELTPQNLAFARGIDATSEYDEAHSGEIPLGTIAIPAYVRMEAIYTYPNKTNKMFIIFPRAQVTSSVEMNLAAEDNVNVPLTFEAKRADSDLGTDGHEVWDTSPLGRIYFT